MNKAYYFFPFGLNLLILVEAGFLVIFLFRMLDAFLLYPDFGIIIIGLY